jgi:hypothetical protein
MRKSNRESIRRGPLSKTLSGFHLYCIWSRPRASALRDNLFLSLPSAHAVFFIVSANFFFPREAHNGADAVCAARILVGQSGAQEHVTTDLEENAYRLSLSEEARIGSFTVVSNGKYEYRNQPDSDKNEHGK